VANSTVFSVGAAAPVNLGTGLKNVLIRNMGPYRIYLGGSGVTDATGIEISSGDHGLPAIGLAALESIFAIAASDAGDVMTEVRVLNYLG
jgi:hypothetical protein